MDHVTHERLAASELTEDMMIGATIHGPDNSRIGDVSHVHGARGDAHVVVDVGGFLGIGAKSVDLPLGELVFMRSPDGVIHATTSLSKERVKALPEHDENEVEDHTYVRPAGPKTMDMAPRTWTKSDEEADKSFPASDPPGNY